MKINKIPLSIVLVSIGLQWAVADERSPQFPHDPANSRTLKIQAQAEEIYTRTDYKRAFFIYRNELAPIGDKYAQYMIGFMYLTGKGVPEDRVAASAWYRLAAERGMEEFVRVRDVLLKGLSAEERLRSDQMFVDLRKQYGDIALMMEEVRKDVETLSSRTGSRLSNSGSRSVTVVSPGNPGGDYYRQVEKRLRARLDYIASRTEVEITSINVDDVDLDSIEQQVSLHLEQID